MDALIYDVNGNSFWVPEDEKAGWLAVGAGSEDQRASAAPYSAVDPLPPSARAAKEDAARHRMMLKQLQPGGKIITQAYDNGLIADQARLRIELKDDADGGATKQLAEAEAAGTTPQARCAAICSGYDRMDAALYAGLFDGAGNANPPAPATEVGAMLLIAAVTAATPGFWPIALLIVIAGLLVLRTKTNAFETKYQNHIFQNAAIANIGDATGLPASATEGSLFVALYTTTPTDSTAGTETTYTGYARIAVARNSSNWTELNGNIENTNDITFGELTAGAATMTGFAILTAVSAGDQEYFGAFTTSKLVSIGTTPRILAGQLDIQED